MLPELARPLERPPRAALSLVELRERFRIPLLAPSRLSTGWDALDAWLGGWPQPGVTEVSGLPGSGRLAPILPVLGQLSRQGRVVAVVDPLRRLCGAGLPGVLLDRILWVQPAPLQAGWAAEQVARSGAVEGVLVLDAGSLGKAGARLSRAAEAGKAAVWVVNERSESELPAVLRLQVEGWLVDGRLRLRCTRGRGVEGERWLHPKAL